MIFKYEKRKNRCSKISKTNNKTRNRATKRIHSVVLYLSLVEYFDSTNTYKNMIGHYVLSNHNSLNQLMLEKN